MATIRVRIPELRSGDSGYVHHYHNAAESVWRTLNNQFAIDLDEIDRGTSFHIRKIPSRKVRRAVKQVSEILEKGGIFDAVIETVPSSPD